jgi:hypothetical protein
LFVIPACRACHSPDASGFGIFFKKDSGQDRMTARKELRTSRNDRNGRMGIILLMNFIACGFTYGFLSNLLRYD